MSRYTNIELCSECANDPATLYNIQTLIIPTLNGKIYDARNIIKISYTSIVTDVDYDVISLFRKDIVDTIKAIRIFYKRFPELERTYIYRLGSYSDKLQYSLRRKRM